MTASLLSPKVIPKDRIIKVTLAVSDVLGTAGSGAEKSARPLLENFN